MRETVMGPTKLSVWQTWLESQSGGCKPVPTNPPGKITYFEIKDFTIWNLQFEHQFCFHHLESLTFNLLTYQKNLSCWETGWFWLVLRICLGLLALYFSRFVFCCGLLVKYMAILFGINTVEHIWGSVSVRHWIHFRNWTKKKNQL